MNDRDLRLKEVAGIAVVIEKKTGCPAQLMIAQWAIESQWGEKPVGRKTFSGLNAPPGTRSSASSQRTKCSPRPNSQI